MHNVPIDIYEQGPVRPVGLNLTWNTSIDINGRHSRCTRPRRKPPGRTLYNGVKYAFPVQRGETTRGMPTAHAAPPLSDQIADNKGDLPPVWPDPDGEVRGATLEPLTSPEPRLHDATVLLTIVGGRVVHDRLK